MTESKNWLEWLVFGVASLLVAAVFGYLLFLGLHRGSQPPFFKVTLGQPAAVPDGFQVAVSVHNLGEITAQSVEVEVLLQPLAAEAETAHFTIDYVPENSICKGWVVFKHNPAAAPNSAKGRVLGFKTP